MEFDSFDEYVEASLEDFAAENGVDVTALSATIVFAEDGTSVTYKGDGTSETGTYTFDGTNGESTDAQGTTDTFTIEGDKLTIATSTADFKFVLTKNDAFEAPAAEGGEEAAEGTEEGAEVGEEAAEGAEEGAEGAEEAAE